MGAIGKPKREIYIPVIEPATPAPDPQPVSVPEPVQPSVPVPTGS